MSKDLGKTLKESRKKNGLSVKEVSKILISKGFKASDKTIYSWENGNSEPTPDALLSLCKIYGISDILSTFGYERNVDYATDNMILEIIPESDDMVGQLNRLGEYVKRFNSSQMESLLQYAEFLKAKKEE